MTQCVLTPEPPHSQPLQYPWEQTGQAVNEGPIALQRNGRLFITFSASLAMTPDYCLGLLEYKVGGVS